MEWAPLVTIARRYQWVIIGILLTSALVTTFWTLSLRKTYRATCTMEYDPTPARPLGSQVEDVAMPAVHFWMAREWYETQNRIIRSRTVAERVVQEFGLHLDDDFMGPREASEPEPTVRDAAERLLQRLDVEQIKDTRMVEISVEDHDPERAASLANAVADAYKERTTEERLRSTVEAVEYLDDRLRSMQTDLEESDRALFDFKREHDILWASIEDQREVVARNLSQYSQALAETRWKRIEAHARLGQLRDAVQRNGIQAHTAGIDSDPTIQALRRQYQEARVERDELATRYGRNWPDLREVEARLTQIERQLQTELTGLIEGATREVAQLRNIEQGLQQELEAVEQDGNDLNSHAGTYETLYRARESHSKLYSHLLQRSTEAGLSQALKIETVHIVDRATPPEISISPRVNLNIFLGSIVGLALGFGIAFLLSRIDRRIRGVDDVEGLGVTVLGMLPTIGTAGKNRQYYYYRKGKAPDATPVDPARKDLVVHTHPMSALAENVRTVRTNLTFMSADQPLRALVVVSPSPQDGKTTVAVSLGIAMAQSGKRVLLVDTDLRRPRVHRAFNLSNEIGVTSVLVGETSLSEAVRATEVPGMFTLSCGPVPPNPSELLHTASFRELMKAAKAQFDIVIFDSPPLGAVTDAAIIAPQVDGAVIVVKDHHTTRDALGSALRQLRDVGANILGSVVNQLETHGTRYGSGYRYHQYYYSSENPDDDEAQRDAAE